MILLIVSNWASSCLGLVPTYVVLVLGNEGRGPRHTQGLHTRGFGIGLGKLMYTLNSVV